MAVEFLKSNYSNDLKNYQEKKRDSYNSVMQLVRRIAYRNGFKQRRSHKSMLSSCDKEELRLKFIADFNIRYGDMHYNNIINVDETGTWLGIVPSTILARSGPGQTTMAGVKKHSGRLTAVLGSTASGKKLPILFILPGTRNGRIAKQEISYYPSDHYYICQTNAWMDSSVWDLYLLNVLKYQIHAPSAIVLDNLE